jgi:3-oxoacyl-[acyl-carrier protein] reductase
LFKNLTVFENILIANHLRLNSNFLSGTLRLPWYSKEERQGRIINISSVSGLAGNPGQVNYSASKAGIIGMTKSMARELGKKNILVNAIAPGFIKTEMTDKIPEEIKAEMMKNIPLQRLGKPEDIADCVEFLISDKASYITGQVISVNGGFYM